VKMMVKPLDPQKWIEIDKTFPDQLALKKKLIVEKWDEVFVSNDHPSTNLAKREVLDQLVDFLPNRFPTIYKQFDDKIANLVTGDEFVVKGEHLEQDPLLIASLLIQEDLCIMEKSSDNEEYQLTAGCVCFPMRWRLVEKFNKPLTIIHKPVQPFVKHLIPPVTKVFNTLPVKAPIWRYNWGIFDDLAGSLDLHSPTSSLSRVGRGARVTDVAEAGEQLLMRVERQTLSRLPLSNAILFTIRTYQRPLKEFEQYREHVPTLIEAIEKMDETFVEYKNRELWKDITISYLKTLCEAPAAT